MYSNTKCVVGNWIQRVKFSIAHLDIVWSIVVKSMPRGEGVVGLNWLECSAFLSPSSQQFVPEHVSCTNLQHYGFFLEKMDA